MRSKKPEGGGDALESTSATFIIIREVYDSENSHEKFECELETALENRVETIVIEPVRLGDETCRWISVGNCLHKTSVLAGLISIGATAAFPTKPLFYLPFTSLTLFSTAVYTLSWQGDPCCKYQVETNISSVPRLSSLSSSSPVVLVRRDDRRRKTLHTVISLSAIIYASYRLYNL